MTGTALDIIGERKKRHHFHVVAVTVAADLTKVNEQADFISLEAMNAEVLVARAGTHALGFKPITSFMVSMARDLIDQVREINQEALAMSRVAVGQVRVADANRRCQVVRQKIASESPDYGATAGEFLAGMEQRSRQMSSDLAQHSRRLLLLLDQINELMTAAEIVIGTSRVEAAAIDPMYRRSFELVSDKLDESSRIIRKKVIHNRQRLQRAAEKGRRRRRR